MTTRITRVGRVEQAITTTFVPGTAPGFEQRHEHVVLETPKPITESQRMRLMTYRELKQSWQSQE